MSDLTRQQIKDLGLNGRDVRRIERAFCTLADFEGPVTEAMGGGGNNEWAFHAVVNAMRTIADGWEENG